MKKYLVFSISFFVFCLGSVTKARCQNWEWMKGATNGESCGLRVTTDKQGNVYNAGYCWGDGNIGTYTFSNGTGLAFMPFTKYDADGNLQWMIMAGHCSPVGLVTDNFGNEYLFCVYTDSVITFGDHSLANPYKDYPPLYVGGSYVEDSISYFLAKINADGQVLWMKNVGKINSSYSVWFTGNSCLTTDVCGDLYVTGIFINQASIGDSIFTSADTGSTPQGDIFIAKLDSSGSVSWANKFGSADEDWPNGLAIAPSGNLYVAGEFQSSQLQIGNTVLADSFVSSHFWSMFLAKFDDAGNPIWAKTNKGDVDCESYAVAVDSMENVYMSGIYDNEIYPAKSPSFDSITLPPIYSSEYAYLLKYDSAGNAIWGKSWQGESIFTTNLTIDPCGNIWMMGTNNVGASMAITDTVDNHVINIPMPNYNPGILAAWNSNGDFINSTVLPASAWADRGYGIASDLNGNIYVTSLDEMDTFIIAMDSLYNTMSGLSYNEYIAKYSPGLGCVADTLSKCSALTVNNINVTSAIDLYPNPATNEINVTSSDPITSVSINNIFGQRMYNCICSTTKLKINISKFPTGVYFVCINGVEVRKIIKQ